MASCFFILVHKLAYSAFNAIFIFFCAFDISYEYGTSSNTSSTNFFILLSIYNHFLIRKQNYIFDLFKRNCIPIYHITKRSSNLHANSAYRYYFNASFFSINFRIILTINPRLKRSSQYSMFTEFT